MELFIRVVPEVFVWCYIILLVVSEIMGFKHSNSRSGKRSCSKTGIHSGISFGENLINAKHGNEDAGSIERLTKLEGRRDRNRDNLRELRRHHRTMKQKYYQNSDNLLYFCFYKGLTERYYDTLQQHWIEWFFRVDATIFWTGYTCEFDANLLVKNVKFWVFFCE